MSEGKKNEQIVLLVTEEEYEKIEDYWHDNRLSSRSEAVRRLIKYGFKYLKENNKS